MNEKRQQQQQHHHHAKKTDIPMEFFWLKFENSVTKLFMSHILGCLKNQQTCIE